VPRREPPVILKERQISLGETEVLIRPPRGVAGGPTVLLRTDPEGRNVLDVTCTCGRRFDVLIEEDVEEEK
jgi:hypothetical protein